MIQLNLNKDPNKPKNPFFVAKTVNVMELSGQQPAQQHKLLREKSKASKVQSSKEHRSNSNSYNE